MKITRERADGSPVEKVRKPQRHRRTSHNLPLWLMQPGEQQAIAQRRCLMILSVLAGQKSVQEVIEEERVSRTFYYQLEHRGLQGMLKALSPRIEGVTEEHRELTQAREQVRLLSERVKSLTQRKRSAERLLRLLIKSNQARVTTGRRGRPRKALSTAMMPGGDFP
jgi:hypothetical protein